MFRVLSTLSDKLFRDITVFSLMTVMLSACGGGGGSTGTTTQSSAFSVQSTSPLNSATQKSDFPVVAIFSEPVNEATVDTTTFSVDDEFGNPITGIISFSGDKSVVIYTPDLELTDAMNYVATVTTAVTNATGKPLATNKSWSFRASAKANYACVINTPPVGLGLNSYYTKYCDANGMPVIGGNLVPDAALQMAWTQTMNMMKIRQDLYAEMIKQGTKVAIVAEGEGITQIPEYSDLDTVFPIEGGWDARARGLGATPARPISSGAEENLLCYAGDPYLGENIFIHELAHSVEGMGIFFAEPATNTKIETAYANAITNGLYANTYADDTVYEYWAEGVQNWFNVNIEAIPSNGVHNEINTRAELMAYDPALYNIISTIFPADWQPACP